MLHDLCKEDLAIATTGWFYARNQQQFGPVPLAQIRTMLSDGVLSPTDLVWTEGMTNWLPADKVSELASSLASRPALPSSPGVAQPRESPRDPQNPFAAPESDLTGPRFDAAAKLVYAGILRRFIASFIDGILAYLLVIAVMVPVAMVMGADALQDRDGFVLIVQIAGAVLFWLYFALQESSAARATLGKRALGMRVVDLDGRQISFGQATGRHFGKIVSWIICGLGFLFPLFTERKQALHDMMAGCVVIYN